MVRAELPPEVGRVYMHNKTGHLYTVLSIGVYCGKHELTPPGVRPWLGFPEGTELVVYVGHYHNVRGNRVYVRPVSEWFEVVDLPATSSPATTRRSAPRFELAYEPAP